MMRRRFSALLVLLLLSSLLMVCTFGESADMNASIQISDTVLTIHKGRVATLKVEDSLTGVAVKNIIWKSDDENIATVALNGQVKGVGVGSTLIKGEDEKGNFVTCSVNVIQMVTRVSLSEKSFNLAVGVSKPLKVIVMPEDASNQEIIWSSSNEDVATVDGDGVIYAVSKGSAKILAQAVDGSKKEASVSVKVDEYDLVFTSRMPQIVKYYYTTGRFKVKGSVKSGVVSIPKVNESMSVQVSGQDYSSKDVEVTPVRPGTDVVTFKVGKKTYKYTVFVSDDFEDHAVQHQDVPELRAEAKNGNFEGLIFGSSYEEIIDQLSLRFGDDYSLKEEPTGIAIMYTPDVEIAGHRMKWIEFYFTYVLKDDGNINTDINATRLYQCRCWFDSKDDPSVARDLFNLINRQHGTSDYYFSEDEGLYLWGVDDMTIYLSSVSSAAVMLYSWTEGALYEKIVERVYTYTHID